MTVTPPPSCEAPDKMTSFHPEMLAPFSSSSQCGWLHDLLCTSWDSWFLPVFKSGVTHSCRIWSQVQPFSRRIGGRVVASGAEWATSGTSGGGKWFASTSLDSSSQVLSAVNGMGVH